MNRRLFLTKIAAAVGALAATNVLAQRETMGHSSNGHGMDHGQMSGHGMSNSSASGHMGSSHLLPESALPQGNTLPALPKLANVSGTAGTFTGNLTAKPISVELAHGLMTEFWAYNGQIPGPAIEVFEGDTVDITFKNELPQPTTLHWHGLPVPPDQDGNPQDEVMPGATRTYRFTLPEDCAGTYWYHPHGHNTVAEQAFRGLAGAFIVKPKQDRLSHIPVQDWLLSDLKLDADGKIADNSMMDWMNGREGQFVLINGALRPQITLNGATRARIWNACSGRYLNLALNEANVYVIGTDGGLIEQPHRVDALLLSPGERAEVLIVPTKTGQQSLQSLSYDRGKMGCSGVEGFARWQPLQ